MYVHPKMHGAGFLRCPAVPVEPSGVATSREMYEKF
jgi:hypothetical protein